jgi:UDP-glucose 4-epimerase
MDNLGNGHRDALLGAKLIEADLRQREQLDRLLHDHAVECIIHFAAYASVGDSVKNPSKYYENNVAGCFNLLEAMRTHKINKLIFSSSAAVYGEPVTVPIPEDHPKNPTNPYGETKWVMERMLQWYGQAYGMRSVSLRYFNAAGADPEGLIGEDHDPEEHLIPVAILAALGKRDKLYS